MPKRSSISPGHQGPEDVNEIAFRVFKEATDEAPLQESTQTEKNPAAVALGRMGGKVGGVARAAKLTAEERSDIARKAAASRWNNRNDS